MKLFLKKSFRRKFRKIVQIFQHSKQNLGFHKLRNFHSEHLGRHVKVNIYLPPDVQELPDESLSILVFNDGQDMQAIQLAETVNQLYQSEQIHPILIAAVHANADRKHEYGTANRLDYKGRGSKAHLYTKFILQELLPYLIETYPCSSQAARHAIAGFSLGGLSAFDVAWNHPEFFGKIGVFSGSLWWRYKAYDPADPDNHRVVHEMVRENMDFKRLKFWFQTGTEDETEDRNNNGIIDSIDDTLDLIEALSDQGYKRSRDIRYVEVQGGKHHPDTWKEVLGDFLIWAFGK